MAYELTPQDWRDEITAGLEYRRRFGLEDLWSTFESIYYNVHESMGNDGPNVFLSQGDTLLSTLTVPNPAFLVEPTTEEAVSRAPLLQSLDNTLITDMKLSAEVETASLNAYLFGRGFLKIGYDSEFGYDPELDIGGDLQLGMTLSQLDPKGRRLIEHNAQVTPGMPWAISVMPHDIVVPWGTKEIDRAPWIAHRIVRHIDDLKSDRKYQNTSRLQPQISMEDFVNSYRNILKPAHRVSAERDAEFVEIWEIHDRRTGKIYAITWDSDKFLRNQTNALQIENRLPFVGLSFTPRTRAFWTTPDVYYLFHIQMELSDVAVQRTKQRRLSVLKFLYDEGVIDDEELEKILSVDVGVAAKIKQGGKLNEAIMKLDNSPNQTLVGEEELLRANAREQIGFSRNQLGEYSGGRKTAFEAGVVDRSSQLRMSRRTKAIKDMYQETMAIVNNIVFQHWTAPRAIRVMGGSQGERWVKLNGPGLKSRYNYKVSFIDESEMANHELAALQLYGMLSQDPGVDPVELRSYLISRFNNPAFGRIFNADIRAEMLRRELLGAAGVVQPQGGGRGQSRPAQLPQLQGQNGQARLTPP